MDDGDQTAQRLRHAELEAAWRDHYSGVVSYAARRGFDRVDAEEIAAEAFAIAWRKDPGHHFDLPWLLAAARKVAANRRRSATRRRRLFERLRREPVPPPPSVGPGEAGPVGEAFESLQASDRELLALIVWDGLEPREAAEVLGATPAVVSVRLHRAKARLRKKLEAAGHPGGDRGAPERAGNTRDLREVSE